MQFWTLRRLFVSCSLLPLALSLAACPSEDPPVAVWSEAFDTTGSGSLSSVWGSAPDDVFIVGGDETQGKVFHFDGVAWSPMEMPQVGLLVWVFGFGPDDVYAVGIDGTAVHYDGSAWSVLDSGTDQDLWGVWGAAPDDIWVVGGNVFADDPVILHYDGAVFTPVPLDPAENPIGAKALFKVFGIGSKLFAVGQLGLIVEYDGQTWRRVPAGAEANDDFVSLWGVSEDNLVAVGGRGAARIATYDGSTWTTTSPDGVGGLNAVFTDEPDGAFVGGLPGCVGAFDRATGEVVREDLFAEQDIHALWGDSAGHLYAVGGNFFAPHLGVALVRTVE